MRLTIYYSETGKSDEAEPIEVHHLNPGAHSGEHPLRSWVFDPREGILYSAIQSRGPKDGHADWNRYEHSCWNALRQLLHVGSNIGFAAFEREDLAGEVRNLWFMLLRGEAVTRLTITNLRERVQETSSLDWTRDVLDRLPHGSVRPTSTPNDALCTRVHDALKIIECEMKRQYQMGDATPTDYSVLERIIMHDVRHVEKAYWLLLGLKRAMEDGRVDMYAQSNFGVIEEAFTPLQELRLLPFTAEREIMLRELEALNKAIHDGQEQSVRDLLASVVNRLNTLNDRIFFDKALVWVTQHQLAAEQLETSKYRGLVTALRETAAAREQTLPKDLNSEKTSRLIEAMRTAADAFESTIGSGETFYGADLTGAREELKAVMSLW